MWGLGDVWQNEAVCTRLGCPIGEQAGVDGVKLTFERGEMLWNPEAELIYVVLKTTYGAKWGAFVDTYVPSDPMDDPALVAPTASPGAGLQSAQPTGRFGKLWRLNPSLRDQLGWALVPSNGDSMPSGTPFKGAAQDCEGGILFWDSVVCYVLYTDDMSWAIY
jgi:hypothetical protein